MLTQKPGIPEIREFTKNSAPLIHCITNPISIHDCANMILAVGARPIMAEHPEEVEEITEVSSALMLNLGNITDARIISMQRALSTANRKNIPVLLDLVGVTCSQLRRSFAKQLLSQGVFSVIKGNISEILAAAELPYHGTGIDAGKEDAMKLRVGIHGAEPWTEEMRKKIQDILHIECFDIYGLCEITGPGVAMDCRQHKGLHINHDFFYPEILDPITHEPMDDGELGELVFTTLEKEGMPLLRYRTKDLTSIDYSTCECGRTLPRISKFKGRTDDMKVIRGVNVFPTQVETVLLSMGGDISNHYQMIVDRENNADRLTVMVEVCDSVFSDEIGKLDALKQKVAAGLKQALGISVEVKLVEPKTIQRSEGKAKRVIDNRNLV